MGDPDPFGNRLRAAVTQFGPLCVGIDPHPQLLETWGLDDDLDGLRAFALTAAESFAGHVAAVKPQSAFFERRGSRGVAVLEEVLDVLRSAGTVSIVDAKRGDIGSTMQAYADAYCSNQSRLAGDAVTVSPYLGFASLSPVLDLASTTSRGVFVLALTSNPNGAQVQHAVASSGLSVAAEMVAAAADENAVHLRGAAPDDLGPVGLVVGATVGDAVHQLGIDLAAVRGPLLAPGVGAQGATAEDLRRVFGDARANVLASSSREILAAGPDPERLRGAAERVAEQCSAALRG